MLYYFLILLLFFTCLQMCWAQIPPTEIYAPLLDQIDESQIQQWNDNEEWDTNLSIESDQKININQCVESDLYLFPFLSPQDINNIYQQPSTVLFQSLIYIVKTADKCYLTEGGDYACIRKCQQLMGRQRFSVCFQLLMINEPHILIVRSMPEFG